mgnify:FL=1
MPYTHTTLAALNIELANRLADTDNRFWTTAEKDIYIYEALRTFGTLTSFWRERATFTLTAAIPFFDLTTAITTGLVNSTVTDRDIIEQIQFALLEDTSSQAAWNGTNQFTYNDVSAAITRRRNQFLADTGIILTRSTPAMVLTGRQILVDTIIDIRRAAFLGAAPSNYYSQLWREDERSMTTANPDWNIEAGTPQAYSVMAPPPLQFQLYPPPIASGSLDLITVSSFRSIYLSYSSGLT